MTPEEQQAFIARIPEIVARCKRYSNEPSYKDINTCSLCNEVVDREKESEWWRAGDACRNCMAVFAHISMDDLLAALFIIESQALTISELEKFIEDSPDEEDVYRCYHCGGVFCDDTADLAEFEEWWGEHRYFVHQDAQAAWMAARGWK
jgi:hypothetical protein